VYVRAHVNRSLCPHLTDCRSKPHCDTQVSCRHCDRRMSGSVGRQTSSRLEAENDEVCVCGCGCVGVCVCVCVCLCVCVCVCVWGAPPGGVCARALCMKKCDDTAHLLTIHPHAHSSTYLAHSQMAARLRELKESLRQRKEARGGGVIWRSARTKGGGSAPLNPPTSIHGATTTAGITSTTVAAKRSKQRSRGPAAR
jgi:hypothetical protein